MNSRSVVGFFLAVCLIFSVPPSSVLANKGEPGSPEFGYGGRIDLSDAGSLQTTLQTAGSQHFDWLSAEFAWDAYFPQVDTQPSWTALDQLMDYARGQDMAVMLSLTKPPAWAMEASGPNAEKTTRMVEMLIQRYPHTLRAIELFPGANTRSGWRTRPNAKEYMTLYSRVDRAMTGGTFLVAGGLHVSQQASSNDDIKDIDFLRDLYSADAQNAIQVVSLRYSGLLIDPLQAQISENQPVLRHYEEIRKLMIDSGHAKGLIWITALTLSDQLRSENRSDWLARAYQQIRSQLYIGTAFFKVNEAPVKMSGHGTAAGSNPTAGSESELSSLFSAIIALINRN